ncbi:Glutamyl-tRNA(Gln) amidotransferase subunit A [Paraburkholderia domus]|jgi:Asp-tRNAAsn/Glu-tRNAGln amidotransferase A subunit and related amidases|uniref:Glutamyl-tRNA(Gln) amidotransferase subunit A n=1 Tax=Paraburkholderia domus TaxID=2793075 RepID=A0A9N8MQW2_9BURK|nr:amidase [Paraburkholderia domus]MBK5061625.1 amidase [Burkholderia sp. R-70199]MBK5088300.1 amidase [Burkholderia sp. R-69927]MBK5123800.1 amidase [Burkholderia sp. R-69980]MBK5165435.1 amidase [Burkholderia sp. R-70211]CAE6878157.1 Glutamyl-tRNA(Gln) amidotransferase subunit A [Paraburkholderia domus]
MSAFLQEFDLSASTADSANDANRADRPTIAIKDSIDIAGYPTTAASRALADAPPASRHAQVVQQLLDAGWRITGKTNMHELAFGMTGINDFCGTPQNPQDVSRIPGGSSSGSASAVGQKLVDAALGTDTGGSVRGPAACCGIIGLKPTFGRVSREGVAPRETTLDCVGPFGRHMKTIVDVMLAIDPSFDASRARRDVSKARIGIPRVEADSEIVRAIATAISRTGFATHDLRLTSMNDAFAAGLSVINAETWRAFGHLVDSGKLGADIKARLRAASKTTAADLDAAEHVRREFTAEVDAALNEVDVLVLPTMPALPITLDAARAGASVIAMSSLIRPFNLSGHPALTLPVAVEGSPLKAGLQIVGCKGDDETVCAVAARIEAILAG